MDKEQKAFIQRQIQRQRKAFIEWSARRELQELLCLEAGQYPEWDQEFGQPGSLSISNRRMYADWCLIRILKKIPPVLPRDLRTQIEACIEVRERIWSEEYHEAYYREQDKAVTQQLPRRKDEEEKR